MSDINNPETLVYDVLAQGEKTTNIKRGLLHSIIVIEVYYNMPITIRELEQILKNKYNIRTDGLPIEINELKRQKRIVGAPANNNLLSLTKEEGAQLRLTIEKSQQEKDEFDVAYNRLLSKYNIPTDTNLKDDLVELYRKHYQNDIENQNNTSDIKQFKLSLSKYLREENVPPFVKELKEICSMFSYINKRAATSSFLHLYGSKSLNTYISDKTRIVFLDTPVIVYMLCYLTSLHENAIEDWDDPYYIAAKSLYKIKDNVKDKVKFCALRGYVEEAAGELKKAFMIDKIYKACSGNMFIGGTSNTFYNYYTYIKDCMPDDIPVNTFKDFADALNVKMLEPESADFIGKQYGRIKRILEFANVEIIETWETPMTQELDKEYLNILLEKNGRIRKSKIPRRNDEIQVEYCANDNNFISQPNSDRSIATWDFSLAKLRNWLLDEYKEDNNMSFFYVHNPAKQVNAIALASFQINSTCITNDIFNYADEHFDLSHKMQICIEDLYPLIGSVTERNIKFMKRLEKLQTEELGGYDEKELRRDSDKFPLGEVLKDVVDAFQQKDMQPMMGIWKKYIEESPDIQPLLDILSKAMDSKINNNEYDFVMQIVALLNSYEKK